MMHSSYSERAGGISRKRTSSANLLDFDYSSTRTLDPRYSSDAIGYPDSSNYPGWEEVAPEMAHSDWHESRYEYEPQEVDGNEILEFTQFIMVPPKPGTPAPVLREKPPGCKTVFIGGIPTNTTEDMIVELMSTCGTVEQVRSKQRFAHLRFTDLEAVDKAIFYAGWKIRIGGNDDNANCCRIHVDYAQARDDQREYEALETERAREFRNKKRLERALNRSPTPPPIYSFHEAKDIVEVMKGGSDPKRFTKAADTLSYWLTKGMVNQKSSTQIFSCLSAANAAARRIASERKDAEAELLDYKAHYQAKVSGIADQVSTVEAIFEKAKQQKVRDHFSKSQRKTLDLWTKSIQEVRVDLSAGIKIEDDDDDEMDFSDSDLPNEVKRMKREPTESGDTETLRGELDALKDQMDQERLEKQNQAYERSLQIQVLERALQASQQTLLDKARQIEALTEQVTQLSSQVKKSSVPPAVDIGSKEDSDGAATTSEVDQKETVEAAVDNSNEEAVTVEPAADDKGDSSDVCMIIEEDEPEASTVPDSLEAKKIAIVSCFLLSHPHGAKFNTIKAYMLEYVSGCKATHVTELLKKYPDLFSYQESKWRLSAYEDKS